MNGSGASCWGDWSFELKNLKTKEHKMAFRPPWTFTCIHYAHFCVDFRDFKNFSDQKHLKRHDVFMWSFRNCTIPPRCIVIWVRFDKSGATKPPKWLGVHFKTSRKDSVGIWKPMCILLYKFINHNFSSPPSRCGSNWMIHKWPGNFAFQASKSMSGFVMGTSASSSWPCKHPAVCYEQVGLKLHPVFFVKMSVFQEISKKKT